MKSLYWYNVRPIKTIWVAAGTAEAAMYDPKSGENVSLCPLPPLPPLL